MRNITFQFSFERPKVVILKYIQPWPPLAWCEKGLVVSVFLASETLNFSSKVVDKGFFGKKPGERGGRGKFFSLESELGLGRAPTSTPAQGPYGIVRGKLCEGLGSFRSRGHLFGRRRGHWCSCRTLSLFSFAVALPPSVSLRLSISRLKFGFRTAEQRKGRSTRKSCSSRRRPSHRLPNRSQVP